MLSEIPYRSPLHEGRPRLGAALFGLWLGLDRQCDHDPMPTASPSFTFPLDTFARGNFPLDTFVTGSLPVTAQSQVHLFSCTRLASFQVSECEIAVFKC